MKNGRSRQKDRRRTIGTDQSMSASGCAAPLIAAEQRALMRPEIKNYDGHRNLLFQQCSYIVIFEISFWDFSERVLSG
jgi:hypothetical protein